MQRGRKPPPHLHRQLLDLLAVQVEGGGACRPKAQYRIPLARADDDRPQVGRQWRPGLERLLFGMSAGQRQMFTVSPEDAFGQPSDGNVQCVPRGQFEPDAELEIGLVYSFADASGGELPGMIIAFDDDEVTVDFNHPLAGRTILFDVLVHRVEAAELH